MIIFFSKLKSCCFSALRIALIQMKIGSSKVENLAHANQCIQRVVKDHRPQIVALPECFNSPYGTKFFNEFAENIPNGETCQELSKIAKEQQIYLIGGTIPERDSVDNKLYNTCTVWSPSGDLIGTYRKVENVNISMQILLNGIISCRFIFSISM